MLLELRHNRYLKLNNAYKVIVNDIHDAVRILKILRKYDEYSGWGGTDFDQLDIVYDDGEPITGMTKRSKWVDEDGNDLEFYMAKES